MQILLTCADLNKKWEKCGKKTIDYFILLLCICLYMKKEYVSVSARIPKDVFDEMVEVRDKLEVTTNQMVTHCIQDWVELTKMKTPALTHRLEVARFSLNKTNKQNTKL